MRHTRSHFTLRHRRATNTLPHGLLTASRHSIEAAAFWFIALERCCQQQLLIDATGIAPKLVSPESALQP